MENYIAPQNIQIIEVIGEVHSDLSTSLLHIGDTFGSGTTLTLTKNSEIMVALSDGTQQRIYNSDGELITEIYAESPAELIDKEINKSELTDAQNLNNVQNEIAAIQDLILSEDDVEIPDTAAGLNSNEGTSFTTISRTGDETLAQSGYDTNEQQNNLTTADRADAVLISSISDDDEVVSINEDTIITGNILDGAVNANNTSVVVTSFEVAGEIYEIGSTVLLNEGELTLNADGSYTFVPEVNYNSSFGVHF